MTNDRHSAQCWWADSLRLCVCVASVGGWGHMHGPPSCTSRLLSDMLLWLPNCTLSWAAFRPSDNQPTPPCRAPFRPRPAFPNCRRTSSPWWWQRTVSSTVQRGPVQQSLQVGPEGVFFSRPDESIFGLKIGERDHCCCLLHVATLISCCRPEMGLDWDTAG